MSRIDTNPGFAGGGGGFYGEGTTWLDWWIDDFFSGSWLPAGPPSIDRRDIPTTQFPVGPPVPPIHEPGPSVPELVPRPDPVSSTTILEETDIALTDAEWMAIYHPNLSVGGGPASLPSDLQDPTPPTPGTGVADLPDPIYNPPEEPVAWYDDIYDLIDIGIGGWLPGGPASPSWDPSSPGPVFLPGPNIGPSMPPSTSPPVTIDPGAGTVMPTAPGNHQAAYPSHYVYKLVNNQWKWVHKRKRRCKRLLTASQARDLQLLMSITGKSSELTKIIVARGGLC